MEAVRKSLVQPTRTSKRKYYLSRPFAHMSLVFSHEIASPSECSHYYDDHEYFAFGDEITGSDDILQESKFWFLVCYELLQISYKFVTRYYKFSVLH